MTITETLQKIDDMLSLMGHSHDNNLKQYFTTTNKKTSVATDQIVNCIQAVKDRHLRTAINALDQIHNKSIHELTNQISMKCDYILDTIKKLQSQIFSEKLSIKVKMNSYDIQEKLIHEEYVLLRGKYVAMLRESYSEAHESMNIKENLHKDTLQRYVHDLDELTGCYNRIDTNIINSSGTNPSQNQFHVKIIDQKTKDKAISTAIRRQSLLTLNGNYNLQKSVAQQNNELALTTIEEKLNSFYDKLFEKSVESFEDKIETFYIENIKEHEKLFQFKEKYVKKCDEEYIAALRNQEELYENITQELSNEVCAL